MARVTFTLNCKSHANGRKNSQPYFALPGADSELGQKIRSKDGTIIPHIIPQSIIDAPKRATDATHAVYTHNGRVCARELGGKVYRITDAEASYLRNNFPDLIELLPDEELHADTVGALLDEKKAAENEAKAAEAKRAEASKQLSDTEVELAQERAAKGNLEKEVQRLNALLKKAKAGPTEAKKPAAKKEPTR